MNSKVSKCRALEITEFLNSCIVQVEHVPFHDSSIIKIKV